MLRAVGVREMASKPAVYSVDDLEEYAANHLPKMARDYFNGGALDGITLRANREEFQKWYIRPRVLRNVADVQTKTKVFPGGNEIPFPCCIAPAAMQRMAHPDGEEATARGCGSFGTVMGLSTFATTSLEDVKVAADLARQAASLDGPSECVLQMYLFENRETSKALVRRAEGKPRPKLSTFLHNLTREEQSLTAVTLYRGRIQGYRLDCGHSLFWAPSDRDPQRLQGPATPPDG